MKIVGGEGHDDMKHSIWMTKRLIPYRKKKSAKNDESSCQ